MATKILLADDSRLIVTMLTSILKSGGFEVITAKNGTEALLAVYNQRPDIALVDIIMPDITGYMVCRIIKENPENRDIPVVLLTGREDKNSKFWGVAAGADFYMVKDNCEPKKLLQTVNDLLQEAPARDKVSTNNQFSANDILTSVCKLFAPHLDATIIHQKVGELALIEDNHQAMKSLFEILANTVDFHLGIVHYPSPEQMFYYHNQPLHAQLRDMMHQQIFSQDESTDCRSIILRELEMTEQQQDLKSFFFYPVLYQGKEIAQLMLGSAKENLFHKHNIEILNVVMESVGLLLGNLYARISLEK